MKTNSCGWRVGQGLGHRSYGCWGGNWRRGMPRLKDEGTNGVQSYMDHVSDAASFEAFARQEENPLLSAETLPESSSLIDFKAFAYDYPDRLILLLKRLRPEFVELFAEYWLLGKSQSFIGKVHGFIQTRVWQALRIIERAIGAFIVLGPSPDHTVLRPILKQANLEITPYGSLTEMIVRYASSQNYALVAKEARAPVPAIRKIFRPAITQLLASKNLRTAAVGAYLHNLTHQASLTGAGLSRRCKARNRRVKLRRFSAPPSGYLQPLISFGHVESLGDISWNMLEISSAQRMAQILPLLQPQGKRLFGKKPGQIFAPLNSEGELAFGYIFARSVTPAAVRNLTHIRGISEMATVCNGEGNFDHAVTVRNSEVQAMMTTHTTPQPEKVRLGDFVEILTGEASKYCGTIIKVKANDVTVEVNFPTGRQFVVKADITSVKKLPKIPISQRAFWGVLDSN